MCVPVGRGAVPAARQYSWGMAAHNARHDCQSGDVVSAIEQYRRPLQGLAKDRVIRQRLGRRGRILREAAGEESVVIEPPDRRHVARLSVPAHFGGAELEPRLVRLIDLSTEGARVEHAGHLHEGLGCILDLPPALGGLRLSSRVVWNHLYKGEQTLEGDRNLYYQSGLTFTGLTADQRGALAAALQTLKAAPDSSEPEPPR
jgi:hypothetical protein